jgi:glucose 1-dehydrogenase
VGELDGRVAIVTGAGSGIGYAIAERLGREGAHVAVDYFGYADDAKRLAEKLSAGGAPSIAIEADVSKRAEVDAMVARVGAELGPVAILVNNAGIEKAAPFLDVAEEDWDAQVAVNLKGPFLCSQACGRVMRDHGGGTIVNVSSVHEDVAFLNHGPYAASKGGLRMLMRNMAVELAPFGIRVNNVAPGPIATPINREALSDPKAQKELERAVPLARWGTPEEVAEVVLFLASDRSSYVTGSTYGVDGGLAQHTEPI